jgi:hypothetical protein
MPKIIYLFIIAIVYPTIVLDAEDKYFTVDLSTNEFILNMNVKYKDNKLNGNFKISSINKDDQIEFMIKNKYQINQCFIKIKIDNKIPYYKEKWSCNIFTHFKNKGITIYLFSTYEDNMIKNGIIYFNNARSNMYNLLKYITENQGRKLYFEMIVNNEIVISKTYDSEKYKEIITKLKLLLANYSHKEDK